ncbi:hypothetical protein HF690_10855 [Oleiagrimonas citrea]|uniref:Alpha-2-macroglobulin domain-containing protein n=1 Tax=Oleiagrimonas citrea TaxID=1665687 RepID=A0A846ZN81_9GAMM|nr:alpha-2-macroglobulin family protein [Oleiagrimonas citrea]NKZ39446.1 hypothetical protein [Oleiagrimonas citrea]
MKRHDGNVHVSVAPDPGCEWRWLDTSELACRLHKQKRFRPATRYTVTVDTALKAMDGSHLDAPVTQRFTTWRPRADWASFEGWLSPVKPSYSVRFNMPVTLAEVATKLVFESADERVPVKVTPYTTKRTGPIWLPVPGAPGALVLVNHPKPAKPLDANKPLYAAHRVWQVVPQHDLKPATDYALTVIPGLKSPMGSLPGEGGVPNGADMHTYGAFAFGGIQCRDKSGDTYVVSPGQTSTSRCSPSSPNLLFDVPVPRATLEAMRWQPLPPTDLHERWKNYPQWFLRPSRDPSGGGRSYPLTFKLKAMHDYAITVPAGVKDMFGRRLAKSATVRFHTGHYDGFLDLPPLPAILEAGENTVVPMRFMNADLDGFRFDYRRLFAGNLRGDTPTGTTPARTVDLLHRPGIKIVPDQVTHTSLGVRELLDQRSGLLWGELKWSAPEHQKVRAMLQVTPYQVFAKLGHFNSMVWVNDFKTGKPVAGAKVRLLSAPAGQFNRLVTAAGHTVTTDADGMASLPGSIALGKSWFNQWGRDSRKFYVSVTHGKNMALLPLTGTFRRSLYGASHSTVWANNRPQYGHMRTWMVSSQGIYQPGSKVKFSVFVRNQDNASLVAPPDLDYTLKVTDPTGNVVLTRQHLKLSAFGDAQAQLHVGPNAPTGWYDVSLSWPTPTGRARQQTGRFMVTEFVPAPFHVQAMLKGTYFGPGDTVPASASARLHAGGPYTDAKVRFTTQIVASTFAPDTPLASGFSFGGYDYNAPPSVTVAQTDGMLDHDGNSSTKIKLPSKTHIVYGRVQLEAAVQSARATRVAAQASAVYTARDRFIGLRTDSWLQNAGKPFDVQYLVVDADGTPQAGNAVKLDLQHRVISSTRVKNASGDFDVQQDESWHSEDHCQARSTTRPAQCALTPKHPGNYRVMATVTDTRGRVQKSVLWTWVTGAGEVLWPHKHGVTLVPDKKIYHVGDVAHVMVQNPYPGAQALVTVERYGMLWKKRVTLKGGAPVIDVPVDKSMFPGAYLSVTIFSPRVSPPSDPDLGKPQVAMGYLPLHIQGKGSALKVAVAPDAPLHKPRETVKVDVKVRGPHGKAPGRTRLVAVVIDQSVLDLLPKGAATYDPLARFYAPPQGPDMGNYSLAEQLISRLQPRNGKGQSPGGGGGASAGPNVRSQFKSAVYWNATLVTDASGNATFRFKLPDNLTRWRILVVAMRPGEAMGLGDASVRVNLPIQIQPALPNQVHVGDHFGAAFNVTNRTDAPRTVDTTLSASGPIDGGRVHRSGPLRLGKFEHGLSWLKVHATDAGAIRFTGKAVSGTLGDAMTTTIPVRRAGATEVAAEYGSLTGGDKQLPVKLPKGALPGSAKLDVNLAPTLIGGLDGAFAVLRDNLLQTWEIRLSRGVLASDYLRLKPVIGDTFRWPNAGHEVQRTLDAASNFQAPNGGMAFWIPSQSFVSPYLSVYTALAFNWLQRAGHTPPADVEKRLHDYLRTQILARKGDEGAAPILRAGAIAALAPGGQLPKGTVAGMVPDLHRLDLFGQALLLEAALDTHDHASARAIVKSLFSYAEESAGAISFNERRSDNYVSLLSTPLRSNCVILDALAKYKKEIGDQGLLGDTPAKLMRWVTRQRRNAGGWPNSQENVFCTTAIVHYADVYETPVKQLHGSIVVSGKAVGGADFASRRAGGQRVAHTLDKAERTGPFQVAVHHGGTGRLYYNVRLTYAMPPDALGATDAGISVSRAYFVQRGKHWLPVAADTVLKRGDIVRVELSVDAPTERHFVVVSDPLPGAFEAVNRQLATAMTSTPSARPGVSVLMFDAGAWPNMSIVSGGFYHRETALDAVRFYADDLPAGHYVLVYSAQVISPGRFIAPAVHAREIYQPDVFGRGRAQHLTVGMPGH